MSAAPPSVRPSRALIITIGVVMAMIVGVGLIASDSSVALSPSGMRVYSRIPAPPRDAGSLLRALGVGSITWYSCALAIPILWWLAYRLPLTHQRAWRALGLQTTVVIALIVVSLVVRHVISYRGAPSAPPFGAFLPAAFVSSALPVIALAAIINAIEARRRAVWGALESQRLRAELAESRLAAVTAQLQPHFLFNTLQSISTLIHRDPVAADAVLAKLSELLRDVLRRSRSALVTFADELRMTQTYLELAQVRFGDRLRITIDVDEAVRGAVVPMLLLQPLIENALTHGVGSRAKGGQVGVSAHVHGGRLRIIVSDDGVGLERKAVVGTEGGLGLANTRERLRHAFGDDQSLELSERPGGGVDVTIQLPFRLERPDGA